MEMHYYKITYSLKSEPYYISREIYAHSVLNFRYFRQDLDKEIGKSDIINFSSDKGCCYIDAKDIRTLICIELDWEEFKDTVFHEGIIEGVPYLTKNANEFKLRDLGK